MDAKAKSHGSKSSQSASTSNASRSSRTAVFAGAGKSGKAASRSTYGALAGTVRFKGDIVHSLVDAPKKQK